MKILYKSIFIIGLTVVSLTATAQKDSTLIRQVLLERDYTPTLQEASKINTLPAIYTPAVKAKDLKFISNTPRITLNNNQLGAALPGEIKTDVDFNKKRGYLLLGAGTHANYDAGFGYRLVNQDRDRLDVFATHSSTNGTVDYIQKDYSLENIKAKYAATKADLKYQHIFDQSILSLGASFYNTSYNYYGNPFIPNVSSVFYPFDLDSRQNVDVFNIRARIKSSDTNEGVLKYDGSIGYQNFKTKYSTQVPSKGPKGGQLDMNVNFYSELGADKIVGVKGSFMNQSFSGNAGYLADAYHSFTTVTGTPYIKFEGSNWDVDLGVNVSAMFDIKTKFMFSPNLKAAIHVFERNTFYAEVTGGVNNNTFLDILQENRYVNLDARVDYSKTFFDAKLGFKSGVIDGLEFDIFAGYKQTDRDHLYLYRYTGITNSGTPDIQLWGNVSTPLYAKVGTGHIGGLLKTDLIPYTDLSAKLTAYFYNVKYTGAYALHPAFMTDFPEKKAWGRPTFTAEFNADVKPIDKLTLSLNYLFVGGRKTYFMSDFANLREVVNMKDINELNFKGELQLTDWLSVNARLNNILFQKYELQYGYPLQGFNVLGGLNFKF